MVLAGAAGERAQRQVEAKLAALLADEVEDGEDSFVAGASQAAAELLDRKSTRLNSSHPV